MKEKKRQCSLASAQLHLAALKSVPLSIGCSKNPCLLIKLLLSKCVTNETSRKDTYGLIEKTTRPQIAFSSNMCILPVPQDPMEDALPSAEAYLEMSSQTAQRELENLPTCIPIEPGWESGYVGETGDCWMVQEARVDRTKSALHRLIIQREL